MRRTLVAVAAMLGSLAGFAGTAHATTTDPVSAWYQQVAQWRSCVNGVVQGDGTLADARNQCGERPKPPVDPRIDAFRKAIEAWKQCVRSHHEAGLSGDALFAACPRPKPSDFGLPTPPPPPVPEWVAKYRAALEAWRTCIRTDIAAGKTEAEAKAHCGLPPQPQDFGAPPRPDGKGPKPEPLAAFRLCVEQHVKAGATLAAAYEACRPMLPDGVNPPPLPPPSPPKTEPTVPTDPFVRCVHAKMEAGVGGADAEAACRIEFPKPLPPPPVESIQPVPDAGAPKV